MVTERLSSDRNNTCGGARTVTQPSTVLFLAANPVSGQQLELGEECRAIENKIQGAKFRDQILFRSQWAARPGDLLQALSDHSPSVLHFSGHGEGEEGLCFQSDDGIARKVSADGLEQVMRAASAGVKVVVLNACFSEVQAKAVVAHVPCVIGIPGAIDDKAAIVYAEFFYRALANGSSVKNAHQYGIAALAVHPTAGLTRDVQPVEGSRNASTPTLLIRPDTDADRIYIVQVNPVSVDGPRVHIVIVIDTTPDKFRANVVAQATAKLFQLGGDLSVEIVGIDEGSVRLTVALSSAAAKTLLELRKNGQLTEICGFDVSALLNSQ